MGGATEATGESGRSNDRQRRDRKLQRVSTDGHTPTVLHHSTLPVVLLQPVLTLTNLKDLKVALITHLKHDIWFYINFIL